MRVKIGDKIHDGLKEPIMIIFDEGEKELIQKMEPEAKSFCSYPPGSDVKEIEKFMEFKEEQASFDVKCIKTAYRMNGKLKGTPTFIKDKIYTVYYSPLLNDFHGLGSYTAINELNVEAAFGMDYMKEHFEKITGGDTMEQKTFWTTEQEFIVDVDNAIKLEEEAYGLEYNEYRIAQNVVGVTDEPHGLSDDAMKVVRERIRVANDANWDHKIGDTVHADLDEEFGFANDATFKVENRIIDEDVFIYILRPTVGNQKVLYEAYASSVSPITVN